MVTKTVTILAVAVMSPERDSPAKEKTYLWRLLLGSNKDEKKMVVKVFRLVN